MNAAEIDALLAPIEVYPATVAAAVRAISAGSRSRDDMRELLDAIRPTPHTLTANPSDRRATPRWER